MISAISQSNLLNFVQKSNIDKQMPVCYNVGVRYARNMHLSNVHKAQSHKLCKKQRMFHFER